MSSAPHVERFKGTNWEECHDFIAAIRTRAFWEGKQRDLAWQADFAATLFWGKALGWHNKLPEDVRYDWSRLETALLDRWPAQGDDEPEIQSTPAAAPSLIRNDKTILPLQGVLKLVVDHSNTNYYVKRPAFGSRCGLTEDTNEALRVRCNSLPSATLLERIDHSCHSWMAAQWVFSNPVIEKGSTEHAYLACFDSDTLQSAWGTGTPLQLLTCTVMTNGEVISRWKKDSISEITLIPFVANSVSLYLAADPEAIAKNYTGHKRAIEVDGIIHRRISN